jgi:hypothetical protein
MPDNQQIIRDSKGNKLGVFLPIEAYEKILNQLECIFRSKLTPYSGRI